MEYLEVFSVINLQEMEDGTVNMITVCYNLDATIEFGIQTVPCNFRKISVVDGVLEANYFLKSFILDKFKP